MTVRDAVETIEENVKIELVWGGNAISDSLRNGIALEAFGDFVIDKLHFVKEMNMVELVLKVQPLRA